MRIDLAPDGNPVSAFLAAAAGRRLDLDRKPDDVHPLQAIPARWQQIAPTLADFADELQKMRTGGGGDGKHLVTAFRRLVYDAAELFEAYGQLLPKCIKPASKTEKTALNDYKVAWKRISDPAKNLCNRFKHETAEIMFLQVRCPTTYRTGARYMISVYREGDALLRDDEIHKGEKCGLDLVRAAHEIVHVMLRVDLAAAKLISSLADGTSQPLKSVTGVIPIGDAIRTIAPLRATAYVNEGLPFDGIAIDGQGVDLLRMIADQFGPEVSIEASLTVVAGTQRYAFM